MNEPLGIFQDYLKRKGLKVTTQREFILHVFVRLTTPVTVDELYQEVVKLDPTISISTLYRTIKLIAGCGLASSEQTDEGAIHYKPVVEVRFVMICECCGTETPFVNPYLDCIHNEASRQKGFELRRCHTVIYGICNSCRKREVSIPITSLTITA